MLEAGTGFRCEEDHVVGNEKFERAFGMDFEFCSSRSSVWWTGEAQTADHNAAFDFKSYLQDGESHINYKVDWAKAIQENDCCLLWSGKSLT